jgi:hypothetical protein
MKRDFIQKTTATTALLASGITLSSFKNTEELKAHYDSSY